MKNIKKYLVFTLITLLTLNTVSAGETTQYKTASPFVRVTTNMLGYNFITKKIASGVLKKTLNKTVKGEYKIKFDSFSGVDLKKGKFKGLTIDGEDLSIDNELFISKMHAETTSDFNYVDYKSKPVVFKTDVPLKYNIEITEADLNKSFSVGKAFDTISNLIPLVKIEKPTIKLEKDKVRLNSALKLPFNKTVKFSMSANAEVENGKIVLKDVETSSAQNDIAQQLINIINKQSLLENINLNVIEDAETNIAVDSIKVDKKKIYVNGTIVIKKS